jgi:hypothetical protein
MIATVMIVLGKREICDKMIVLLPVCNHARLWAIISRCLYSKLIEVNNTN